MGVGVGAERKKSNRNREQQRPTQRRRKQSGKSFTTQTGNGLWMKQRKAGGRPRGVWVCMCVGGSSPTARPAGQAGGRCRGPLIVLLYSCAGLRHTPDPLLLLPAPPPHPLHLLLTGRAPWL